MLYFLLNLILILICIYYMSVEYIVVSKHRKYIYCTLVTISIVLFAFRPESTKDTINYIVSFVNVGSFSITDYNFLQKYDGYELGYILLIRVVRTVTTNYRVFFIFVSAVGLILTLVSINYLTADNWEYRYSNFDSNHKTVPIGCVLAVYISCYGFLYNGISLRAGLATGLGMMGFVLLCKKRFVPGLLFFFLAFSIQRMSIVLAIAYLVYMFFPVLNKRIHYFVWSFLGIMMLTGVSKLVIRIVTEFLMSIIMRLGISGYSAYLTSFDSGVGYADIFQWIVYGLMVFVCDNKRDNLRLLNLIMIGAMIVVFLHDIRAISRVYDMLYLFAVPLLVRFYYGETDTDKRVITLRRTITYFVIIIGSAKMISTCF